MPTNLYFNFNHLLTLDINSVVVKEPPNLSEMLKPIQSASSPASMGLKDEDDDDGEGEDGEGDGEKADPANVNPERLKAFNVRELKCSSIVTGLG